MRLISYLILICLLLSACASKEVEIPAGILQEKEMTGILTDIHIAQSVIANRTKADSIQYTVNDVLPVILRQHHTEKNDFLKSLKFYSENPEILQQVYDSVITGLSKMQGELEK